MPIVTEVCYIDNYINIVMIMTKCTIMIMYEVVSRKMCSV